MRLCLWLTATVIATSGPSAKYPERAYRNPLPDLVKFLNKKHGENWCIWEFRAEGTGYPDSAVDGRIWHYPFPDHHPPPFQLLPHIMASMRDWRKEGDDRVIVVHCKAGKGRSGTASCGYLVSQEGWKLEDALSRFTERRMRPGWGPGVSIPSQIRWLNYVERWAKHEKVYVERKVEVCEIHVYGLRDGVKMQVCGFVDEGKRIKTFHAFDNSEQTIIRGELKGSGLTDAVMEVMGKKSKSTSSLPLSNSGSNSGAATPTRNAHAKAKADEDTAEKTVEMTGEAIAKGAEAAESEMGTIGADAIFRPKDTAIVLETSDICIDLERRTKGAYTWPMVTSIAHVWFNVFFEGNGPENGGKPADSGVFEIEWDALDGLKGSSQKGTRAFNRMAVVWKASPQKEVVKEPAEGEAVKQSKPADWQGTEEDVPSDSEDEGVQKYGV
jgi:protein-tyrosine phosphatase